MALSSIAHQPVARRTKLDRWMKRFGDFVLEYWALMLMLVLGLVVSAALSIPLLYYYGLDSLASPIFAALHLICAQIPAHSFYLYGHQMGMCARNFSIYFSMFLGSLFFVLSKKRMKGIPWWLWLILILPMAIDGTTQMFGLRESTWELRVLTGTLFGLANMWFVLPFMQKTLDDTVQISRQP